MGCFKFFLIIAGACAFAFLICGILVWQSVSWLKNAPDPVPATYEPLKLSGGEQEDVERVIIEIEKAKNAGKLYEDYVTPAVFNGLFEKIFEGERLKGKKDVPLAFRVGLVDKDKLSLKFTSPIVDQPSPDGKPLYINAEIDFEVEIVDGELRKAKVHRLHLRKREAPLLSRMVVNWFVDQARMGTFKDKQGEDQMKEGLKSIKLLKRDGARIHFILDGKEMAAQEKLKEQQENAPQPNTKKELPAEKGGF
ncbi:MAG TPA: hypothetical protein VEK08_24960 [Planctomycetota bacterium]|nr:hypothetical protein [Planctomycetota bacterium]